MPLWSLTKERKDDLLAQRDSKQAELKALKELTPTSMWTKDLEKLEAAYLKRENDFKVALEEALDLGEKKLSSSKPSGSAARKGIKAQRRAKETLPDSFGRRIIPVVDSDLIRKVDGDRKKKALKRLAAGAGDEDDDIMNTSLTGEDYEFGGEDPKPLIERLSLGPVKSVGERNKPCKLVVKGNRGRGLARIGSKAGEEGMIS
ncbi:unnamed protein product [Protopolystoma xenopodis]|uniref:DNA topoisomerase type IIA domain-containing protein n=1 Tax=Protopolystoma xenopodis TaxID=117903 RepID=A0A448WWR5_9PLAT|nr:unnamed protein product [Protopolystoma xenopodis]